MPDAVPNPLLILEPETAALLAAAPQSRWAQLLRYWQGVAERLGRLPGRADIDPVEMGPRLLGSIFMVDIESADTNSADPKSSGPKSSHPAAAGNRYRFRLIGGRIADREIVRPGQYLSDIAHTPDVAGIEQHYLDAIAGRVRLRETNLRWESPDKDHVRYRSLVLPLAAEEGPARVGHLIGCAVYDNED
ncbi:hypothetical protein [Dongia sp.]|uniref:hypothetical protein n=1 Tax=Dongia sp. TaxID=1977262 RepID=UPI0035B01838